MEHSVHPGIQTLAAYLKKWGWTQCFFLAFILTQVFTSLVTGAYSYALYGQVTWPMLVGATLFSATASSLVILFVFYLVSRLNDALFNLKDSIRQEKQLNQSMQETIRQMNFEIEERKQAFQAKHRAVDELRREIIERRKAQQDLEEQTLLTRSILDSSPDLFYYRDETGRIISCNQKFEAFVGKSAAEMIGLPPDSLFPEGSFQNTMLSQQELATLRSEMTLDIKYQAGNGVLQWFEMRKVPFFDKHGKYIGILVFGRDITARKLAEQALEKSYQDKGRFIATLSHELRTPLNGVVGLVQRLLQSKLTKEQRSWSNTIFSSAETLGNIFDDIIDLDKIDRNDLDIVEQSVHLPTFVKDVCNFASLICQQRNLEFIRPENQMDDIYVQIDGNRVRQVLWNLLSNATKFTLVGKVTLEIHFNKESQQLQFQVLDTGIGIADSERDRIFEMYYKSVGGRKLSVMGSGIGLAVSKALIEAMGGNIQLQSEEGVGSCFSVAIPTVVVTAPPLLQPAVVSELTILLVEDIPLNAEIAMNLLEQRGHHVILAETGEDALALLETEDELDLVLLDMQLPDMNGAQVAHHIRSEAHLRHLPIVILSANVRKAEEQLAEVQIEGALAKPINTAKFDQVLNRLFGADLPERAATKSTLHSDILDLDTLDDYIATLGMKTMLRSIFLYRELLPVYLKTMAEAAVLQNIEAFRDSAHKLKGASASVGLLWVQQEAKHLETEVEIEWQGIERMLEDFHLKIERHLAALEEYVQTFEGLST